MTKRGLLIGIFILSSTLLADSIVNNIATLKSDTINYTENGRTLIAKGNVQLTYNNITIETTQLNINIDTNYAWSIQPTRIKRKDSEFKSASFSLDLNKENIILTNIAITVTPPENKGALYITSKKLTDTPEFKSGEYGRVTTCELNHPHHFILAKKYKYTPDKHLTMYNVTFYNKLLFIPIVFWSPIYKYHLGKRKTIWNFPTIGKKERDGWGWFIQNTIDYKYENNQESSIHIDWFQKKGIGYGIKHHYYKGPFDGFLYGYNFNFEDNNTQGNIEKKSNLIYKWENTYTPNHKLNIISKYHRTNIDERINSTGSEDKEKKYLAFNYNHLGNTYKINYETNDNKKESNKNKSQKFSLSRKFNNENRYDFNFNEQKIDSTKRKTQSMKLNRNFIFPNDYSWRTNISLDRLDTNFDNTEIAIDDKLYIISTLTKTINKRLSVQVLYQQFYDLDGDRVTTDIQNNNYLYKKPEVTFSLKKINYKTINFEQHSTIARYQETRYNSTKKTLLRFPDTGQFSAYPNTYIFKQKLSQQLNKLPFKGTLSTNFEYNQYFFSVPGHSITDGDQMYNIKFNTTHTATWLPFIKTNTRYSRSLIDNENNSPYYQINKLNYEEQKMTETMTLFYTKQYKNQFPYYFNINWTHSTGLNWLNKNQKWDDYSTKLRLDISKKFDTTLSTGRKLNNFTDTNTFHPLNIQSNIKTNRLTLHYQVAFDMNQWINENINTIQSSRFTISTKLGKEKDYQWEVKTTFSYNTASARDSQGNRLGYNINHYELQQINIVKNEHKRKLMIGYNKPNKEWTIQYQFMAFPDDPLKFKKNREGWKMEGRFNQSAVERFN